MKAWKLSLRSKVYLLTIIPLLLVMVLVSAFSINESRELGQREIEVFESQFYELRRQELRNYLDLALTAIESQRRENTPQSREKAKQILRQMGFGDDGYYFAYNYDGINLVHPKLPDLEGQNLYGFEDLHGNPVIQSLIERAREGGGFHEYLWHKPSRDEVVGKLSYAVGLDDWGWMIGTGLYIDDLQDAIGQIRRKVDENVQRTLVTSVAVALLAILMVTVLGLGINVSESQLANRRLKDLSQRTMQFEESEKVRISRELHDGINQMLVSIRYRLEAMIADFGSGGDKVRGHAEQASETIVAAIAEVRRIS
ncbi:MAG: cache domain-containing protein, partial [Pseudomonadota bacterium]